MSLRDFLSDTTCPACEGAGTIHIADATTPGRTFAHVCNRCGGAGSVRGQLTRDVDTDAKYACPKCGALHDAPVYTARDCLFCGDTLPAPHPEAAE